ncbi:hypothetical protein LTR49_027157 [Elasticomyces elasticus]|nr:hypothetical protein LTR49_027157 [Elasticomyces elasticus]
MTSSRGSAGKRKAEESPARRQRITYTNIDVINRLQREHYQHLGLPNPSPPFTPPPPNAEVSLLALAASGSPANKSSRNATISPSAQQSKGSALSNNLPKVAAVGESATRGVSVSRSEREGFGRNVTARSTIQPKKSTDFWVLWHDGCYHLAKIIKEHSDHTHTVRYASSTVTMPMKLEERLPNFHGELPARSHRSTDSDSPPRDDRCIGRLILAPSKTLGCFIPGRVVEYHKSLHGIVNEPPMVKILFLCASQFDELIPWHKLKAMYSDSATKLTANGEPIRPRPYSTHHPEVARLNAHIDSRQEKTLRLSKPEWEVGTLVLARWPPSKQFHLAVVASGEDCPGVLGVPVLFFQDLERKDVRKYLIVRVAEQDLEIAPDLPKPPQYEGKRSKDGSAERQWLRNYMCEVAEIVPGQYVAAHYHGKHNPNGGDHFVFSTVDRSNYQGIWVKILGRGPTSQAVLVHRATVKPLFQGCAMVYTRCGAPVWPEPSDKIVALGKASAPKPWRYSAFAKGSQRGVNGTQHTVHNLGGYRKQVGWLPVLGSKQFDKASEENPTVEATVGLDVAGILDATVTESLMVWTPHSENIKFAKTIKISIHDSFSVHWNLDRNSGILVEIRHDDVLRLAISLQKKQDAFRVMKNMKKKLEKARRSPSVHEGNSKNFSLVED